MLLKQRKPQVLLMNMLSNKIKINGYLMMLMPIFLMALKNV